MEITKAQVERILETLPIGYYIKRNVEVVLSNSESSYCELINDKIVISYPMIQKAVKDLEDDSNLEMYIRTLLYHETSHAFLTPLTLKISDIINIFEDERIETIFNTYYKNTNFKKLLYDITKFKGEEPKSPMEEFYQTVRFRKGRKKFVNRVNELIMYYKNLSRDSFGYYVRAYTDDIKNLFDCIKDLWETKDLETNMKEYHSEEISISNSLGEIEQTEEEQQYIKESLKNISFIGGMDHCLCREANKCKDYPQDFGCLFLGEPGRHILKHGLGRELTYEEACQRIDKAAELGLMCQAAWLEIEHWFWAIRNDQEDKFLEVCFCCPCCCVGMRLMRNTTIKERHRFHPSGWTAVADRTKCVGCKMCVSKENGCPIDAISIGEDGKVVIDQETCLGCGICKNKCKLGVIKIKQVMPMRKDLHEYFEKDYNIDLKLWKDQDK